MCVNRSGVITKCDGSIRYKTTCQRSPSLHKAFCILGTVGPVLWTGRKLPLLDVFRHSWVSGFAGHLVPLRKAAFEFCDQKCRREQTIRNYVFIYTHRLHNRHGRFRRVVVNRRGCCSISISCSPSCSRLHFPVTGNPCCAVPDTTDTMCARGSTACLFLTSTSALLTPEPGHEWTNYIDPQQY